MIKTPKVLFIKDVFASDYKEEDLTEAKFREDLLYVEDDEPTQLLLPWSKIPEYFVDLDTHPKVLNVQCWTCSNSCAECFISIADRFDKPTSNSKYKIKLLGAFNSWPCLQYYINNMLTSHDQDRVNRNNLKWYSILTNVKRISQFIACTDPYKNIKCFGVGVQTVKQWLDFNNSRDASFESQVQKNIHGVPLCTVSNVSDESVLREYDSLYL